MHINTHLFQGSVMVLLRQKVYVSGGNYADQLAAHLTSLCNRNPRETVAYLCLKHIPHCVPGTHYHWVCDETLLKFLARTKTQVLSVYWLENTYVILKAVSQMTFVGSCL